MTSPRAIDNGQNIVVKKEIPERTIISLEEMASLCRKRIELLRDGNNCLTNCARFAKDLTNAINCWILQIEPPPATVLEQSSVNLDLTPNRAPYTKVKTEDGTLKNTLKYSHAKHIPGSLYEDIPYNSDTIFKENSTGDLEEFSLPRVDITREFYVRAKAPFNELSKKLQELAINHGGVNFGSIGLASNKSTNPSGHEFVFYATKEGVIFIDAHLYDGIKKVGDPVFQELTDKYRFQSTYNTKEARSKKYVLETIHLDGCYYIPYIESCLKESLAEKKNASLVSPNHLVNLKPLESNQKQQSTKPDPKLFPDMYKIDEVNGEGEILNFKVEIYDFGKPKKDINKDHLEVGKKKISDYLNKKIMGYLYKLEYKMHKDNQITFSVIFSSAEMAELAFNLIKPKKGNYIRVASLPVLSDQSVFAVSIPTSFAVLEQTDLPAAQKPLLPQNVFTVEENTVNEKKQAIKESHTSTRQQIFENLDKKFKDALNKILQNENIDELIEFFKIQALEIEKYHDQHTKRYIWWTYLFSYVRDYKIYLNEAHFSKIKNLIKYLVKNKKIGINEIFFNINDEHKDKATHPFLMLLEDCEKPKFIQKEFYSYVSDLFKYLASLGGYDDFEMFTKFKDELYKKSIAEKKSLKECYKKIPPFIDHHIFLPEQYKQELQNKIFRLKALVFSNNSDLNKLTSQASLTENSLINLPTSNLQQKKSDNKRTEKPVDLEESKQTKRRRIDSNPDTFELDLPESKTIPSSTLPNEGNSNYNIETKEEKVQTSIPLNENSLSSLNTSSASYSTSQSTPSVLGSGIYLSSEVNENKMSNVSEQVLPAKLIKEKDNKYSDILETLKKQVSKISNDKIDSKKRMNIWLKFFNALHEATEDNKLELAKAFITDLIQSKGWNINEIFGKNYAQECLISLAIKRRKKGTSYDFRDPSIIVSLVRHILSLGANIHLEIKQRISIKMAKKFEIISEEKANTLQCPKCTVLIPAFKLSNVINISEDLKVKLQILFNEIDKKQVESAPTSVSSQTNQSSLYNTLSNPASEQTTTSKFVEEKKDTTYSNILEQLKKQVSEISNDKKHSKKRMNTWLEVFDAIHKATEENKLELATAFITYLIQNKGWNINEIFCGRRGSTQECPISLAIRSRNIGRSCDFRDPSIIVSLVRHILSLGANIHLEIKQRITIKMAKKFELISEEKAKSLQCSQCTVLIPVFKLSIVMNISKILNIKLQTLFNEIDKKQVESSAPTSVSSQANLSTHQPRQTDRTNLPVPTRNLSSQTNSFNEQMVQLPSLTANPNTLFKAPVLPQNQLQAKSQSPQFLPALSDPSKK